jgi:hypothetical protein
METDTDQKQKRLQFYLSKNIAVVPVEKGKSCTVAGWQSITTENPPAMNGAANLAAVLGDNSAGVVALDCDWPEAAQLAKHLLPNTVRYGREAWPQDHLLYTCPGAVNQSWAIPAQFSLNNRRRAVLELLGTGKQCLLPGSTHDNGDKVVFDPQATLKTRTITGIEAAELVQWLPRIAAGAVLVYLWGDMEGSRHDLAMALAGACCHAGWTAEEMQRFFSALFDVVEDNESKDRLTAVNTTWQRFNAGDTVNGWPAAAEILGQDWGGLVKDWLGVGASRNGDSMLGLTSNGPPVIDENGWPELLPFSKGVDATGVAYPVHALGKLQPVVEAVAELQQVPHALAAQAVLTAHSSAAQGLYDVVDGTRKAPLSLFMLCIAEPGERKTSTTNITLESHKSWMAEHYINYQIDLDAWEASKRDGKKPACPTLFVTGGTTDGLLKSLSEEWPAVMYANADAAQWLYGYSMREGRSSETLSKFCGLWDGCSDSNVTVGRGVQLLFDRRVTLSLMIQPEYLPQITSREFVGQGFSSRLLVAMPQGMTGQRPYKSHTAYPPELVAFLQRVQQLLSVPLERDAGLGGVKPKPVTLSAQARECYEQHFNEMEFSQAKGGELEHLSNIVSKAPAHLLRLAANLAVYDHRQEITAEDINSAAELVHYYNKQWAALTSEGERAHDKADALRLLEWLEKHSERNPGPFKLRPLYNGGLHLLRGKSDKAKKLLQLLLQRGYVRQLQGGYYELRPKELLEE